MKIHKLIIIALCVLGTKATAQQSINELLAAGVAETQRFAEYNSASLGINIGF